MLSYKETQAVLEEETADLPFTWDEVKGTEDFQSLDRETQEAGKQEYFDTYISPRGVSWEQFQDQTDPSILERVGAGFRATGASFTESAALGVEKLGFKDTAKEMRGSAAETRRALPGPPDLQYPDSGFEQFKNIFTTEFWTDVVPEAIPQSVPILVAGMAGGVAGAKTGAVTGAAVGTAVLPGPGTAAGAAVGTAAGGIFGKIPLK